MSDLVLIVRLAGQRVALRAKAVFSVVDLDEITPVPRAATHIAGLAALRSRVLTVIDTHRALGLAGASAASREAVVVELEGHGYALIFDGVEDVVEAIPVTTGAPVSLQGGWTSVAAGLVEADGDVLLLVDGAALIAGPQAATA